MKLLTIDTSTEQCSVAFTHGVRIIERCKKTARDHADLVLTMVSEVLEEAALSLTELDGIAFGRGPGGFTGVRIGVSVTQGLALGAQLPTVGISDLAAVAQQVATNEGDILVCMDARMDEVYWAVFQADASGLVVAVTDERVSAPEEVSVPKQPHVAAGTGFAAYPRLRERFAGLPITDEALPGARDIAKLAEREFALGRGVPARDAQPVYVRNNVATVKPIRNT